jgi:hypothetical protein
MLASAAECCLQHALPDSSKPQLLFNIYTYVACSTQHGLGSPLGADGRLILYRGPGPTSDALLKFKLNGAPAGCPIMSVCQQMHSLPNAFTTTAVVPELEFRISS